MRTDSKSQFWTGSYQNLFAQAEKLYRHNRQGSYRTRQRYYEAYQRFLRFVAENFRLEKLGNLSGKHLSAYVEEMQRRGLSASTIKTDLSAIRFWHDQIPNARYTLPGNDEFELERRRFGRVDRSWVSREFNLMLVQCVKEEREEYEACLVLARYAGLRLHEALRIDTAIARSALRCGFLTIKGKGGKIREVPINETIRIELAKFLRKTPPGHKLFVPQGVPTHEVKAGLQEFIRSHRKLVQVDGDPRPITYHGLRHTCAAEWYQRLIAEGRSEREARKQVSRWLGHEREDVTGIYLAGLGREGERHG